MKTLKKNKCTQNSVYKVTEMFFLNVFS